ncbi:MAG TPA: NAD(P)-dependent oxidoreductase [Nevskiaceae bacterium]|nr:NAD(P)-dependent oxidoreductase [Nevskiaceae bacterium]
MATHGLCAVTGATGFVGQHLVAALEKAGWRVRVLRRGRTPASATPPHRETVVGALEDLGSIERLVDGVDAVIHAAGLIKAATREAFFQVNQEGAAAVAAITRRVAPGACFVLISTQAAREPHLSDYAASKRAGEDAARQAFGAPMTILRPPAVYGPGDRETLVFFQVARGALVPLLGAPGARAAMIHVGDLSRLIVALAGEAPRDRVLTAADERPDGYTWQEILGAAARAVGNPNPRLVQAPIAVLKSVALAGDVGRLLGSANMLNSQKLREIRHPDWSVAPGELARAPGWSPAFSIDAGFADAVAWYRANGWLPG